MDDTRTTAPICSSIQSWLGSVKPRIGTRRSKLVQAAKQTPRTSAVRLQASNSDTALDISDLSRRVKDNGDESQETVLYLGYGSNLCAETFRGKRGIKPLSQVNVTVPVLSLTFDLPGIPYSEPCFGNTRYRDVPPAQARDQEKAESSVQTEDYHKDRWHKGLVGVVYEVTKSDYAHIIATEGGGSGYQDVLVDCYELSGDATVEVPATPTGPTFKAHTLFAPANVARPEHSYAQPSTRYLKLITDGASEHDLPNEYQDFLHNIRTYHLTSNKQQLGLFIFLSLWAPVFLLFFGGGGAMFLRENGTYPPWFATFARSVFTACWASYDGFFRRMFGDGERTIGDGHGAADGEVASEKVPLLVESNGRQPLSCGHGTFV